jgi:hypothetical protein
VITFRQASHAYTYIEDSVAYPGNPQRVVRADGSIAPDPSLGHGQLASASVGQCLGAYGAAHTCHIRYFHGTMGATGVDHGQVHGHPGHRHLEYRVCAVNVDYLDGAEVDPEAWAIDPDIMVWPRAGGGPLPAPLTCAVRPPED